MSAWVWTPGALHVGRTQTVEAAWIDYNGHMNVGYYSLAFDRALDDLYEDALGLGAALVRARRMGPMMLQNHMHYRAELFEGERFRVETQMLDHDEKRIHLFASMIAERDGRLAATSEFVSMNVDLERRKGAPYPPEQAAAIAAMAAAHAGLARPALAGRPLGLRR